MGMGSLLSGCTAAFLVLAVVSAAPAVDDPAWRLVWADEFDVEGPPNPANWTFETGFVRNEELQFYQPANATCRGGRLVLEARRERVRNPGFVAGSRDWKENRAFAEYTSASLTTRGRYAWQYGRFVMRGRLDTRPGLWPAWWTLGLAGEWPDGGEIDMMEYYRGLLLANVAWGSGTRWVPTWDSVRTPIVSLGPDWAGQFHVWRMDWDASTIRLFVDDRLLNETALADTIDAARKTDPYHQPHVQLLNLAVGGFNGGDPSKTTFPATLEVDYIRVFRVR